MVIWGEGDVETWGGGEMENGLNTQYHEFIVSKSTTEVSLNCIAEPEQAFCQLKPAWGMAFTFTGKVMVSQQALRAVTRRVVW